jgi:hypothetical protein
MDDGWFVSMRQNIKRFKEIGVRVNISELDLRMDTFTGSLQQKLDKQAGCFYNIVKSALADLSACNEVTFWQFSSKYSWIYDFFNVDRSNLPCPWDNDNNPTSAVDAVKKALQEVVLSGLSSTSAPYSTLPQPTHATGTLMDWQAQDCTLNVMYLVENRRFPYSGPIVELKTDVKARIQFVIHSREPVIVTLKWSLDGVTHYKNIVTTSESNIDLTFEVPRAASAFLYVEGKVPDFKFSITKPTVAYF